ncbi:MAG: RluA family pseudouridine synthase [Rikenellaceae bacterium]
MFHQLNNSEIENVELPKLFTNPFDYEPHPLVEVARKELCSYLEGQCEWHAEINLGKMFGVLVCEDSSHRLGFLAAFSGYLDKQTTLPYFVPPILNLLEPNGFFATEETNISAINRRIAQMDSDEKMGEISRELAQIESQEREELERLKEEYRASRSMRRAMRSEGCGEEQMAVLSGESQRQKGAIKRRELHYRTLREPLESRIAKFNIARELLLEERAERSAALQRAAFSRFKPLNALGKPKDLITIFEEYNHTVPPAGSGECAAPKLLHYAFANGLRPVAMGEFWWGESTRGQVRRHMHYYPACRGKCHPILSYMLRGLEVEAPHSPKCEESLLDRLTVIYEDEHLVAFNKPSGLASVRGLNHTISVQSIAEERYPTLEPNHMIVHRLDMDTSGVLIVAKSGEVQRNLQQQFASHTIRKRYIALIEESPKAQSGAIDLPLILDPNDRPRQMVDMVDGKSAYTHYSVIGQSGTHCRIALYPQTGRTHQLRVHCAHCEGLNAPIVGDRLYGTPSDRLMLHAEQITLQHPATGRKFVLRCECEF